VAIRHACPLCDWSREAAHLTVLDPCCARCGGALEPVELDLHSTPRVSRFAGLARSRRLENAIATVVVLPLILAAGKLGAGHAGIAGGVTAALLAVLAAAVALAPGGPAR
jgi:hypothetical protein